MSEFFGHEKLHVYRASIQFVTLGDSLLQGVERRAAACDHLLRAMEGIPLHIAHASSSWSPNERVTYLGHANGSVLECAACLDVLVARRLLRMAQVAPGKGLLRAVCGMLVSLQRGTADRVREDATPYASDRDAFFSHERLDVYRVALELVTWVDGLDLGPHARAGLLDRLDKGSTAIVLHIAEGNGRFTPADHARFLNMAHSAAVESAAVLDLAVARCVLDPAATAEGRQRLERIDAMLGGLARKLRTSGGSGRYT